MVYVGDIWLAKRPADVPLECDVSRDLLDRLEKHFVVHREVAGTHYSGKRVRIDAILVPKERGTWATEQASLGLEVKRGKVSIGEATKLAAQSVDYANTCFDGFGYVYVFSYPDLTQGHFNLRAQFYERFLGQLGVGFLRQWQNGSNLELRLKGHLVWSELQGPVEAARWKMERKFGSR